MQKPYRHRRMIVLNHLFWAEPRSDGWWITCDRAHSGWLMEFLDEYAQEMHLGGMPLDQNLASRWVLIVDDIEQFALMLSLSGKFGQVTLGVADK